MMAAAYNVELCLHGVNAVDDIVEFGQRYRIGVFGKVEQWELQHAAVGVDVGNAFGHDIYLQSADGRVEGDELAVQVRRCNAVGIDQCDGADAAAR